MDCQPNVTGQVQTGVDGSGNPIMSEGVPGEDCIIAPSLMQPAYAAYQVQPPLTRVWSGDNPAIPMATIELQFPDLPTAQSVLAGLWSDS